MEDKDQRKAYVFAIIAVLIWSTVASAFKLSLRYVDHIQLLFYAALVTVVVLFAVLVLQKKLHLLRDYTWKEYLRSAVMGLVNPFLYYLVLFKAYSLLQAQEAQPLNYTWPIWLVLLSIPFLKQKIKALSVVAILISFCGVVMIATGGRLSGLGFDEPWGILLGLGSAVIWASFWIMNLRDGRDEVAKLFLNFCFGTVYIFIVLVMFSDPIVVSRWGLAGMAYVGLFEMGITFLLWSMALRLSKNTARISNLIYLTPFVSLVIIYFFVGESIYVSTMVGLVLIVEGIVIQRLTDRKKSN